MCVWGGGCVCVCVVDIHDPGPSKVFEVGVYSLENRRLPKVVVASRIGRDEGKMGVNCL